MKFIIKEIFKSVIALPKGLCINLELTNGQTVTIFGLKIGGSGMVANYYQKELWRQAMKSPYRNSSPEREQENMNLNLPLFPPSNLLSGMLIQLTQPKPEYKKPLMRPLQVSHQEKEEVSIDGPWT